MRIVFVSDTHGAKLQHDIPEGDVIVHCGDFSKKGTEKELLAFNDWWSALPHLHKIFIAGNHDLMFENSPEHARCLVSGGTYLLDSELVVEGFRFYGSPWTPEFYSWAFMRPRGVPLKKVWERIPSDTDVLVTHGPPQGGLDYVPRSQLHVGCEDLAQAVERVRPAVHAFGHIHEGYGCERKSWGASRDTIFVNASTCNLRYDAVNPPIVIDLFKDDEGRTDAHVVNSPI